MPLTYASVLVRYLMYLFLVADYQITHKSKVTGSLALHESVFHRIDVSACPGNVNALIHKTDVSEFLSLNVTSLEVGNST